MVNIFHLYAAATALILVGAVPQETVFKLLGAAFAAVLNFITFI